MMQSAGIVVNDVTVTWRNGHTALRDASFTVPSGSIAALVGVNGSGKSTLFKAIMGFVRLTSGKISVLGIPTRQALQKNLVAYVPQSEEVDWSFPVLVEDVVMMGRYGHMGMLRIAKKRDRQIVTDALERVDMVDFRHRQIGELSGGQKKRVFLARAIAQQGDVILLDEPFTGVDVKTEAKIPPFYANNKCNQPGNNHRLDYIADGYPEHVAEKNMVKMYVWFDCNIQDQTCGKHARKNNPHHCILLDSAVVFQVSRRHRAEYSGDECPCSQR